MSYLITAIMVEEANRVCALFKQFSVLFYQIKQGAIILAMGMLLCEPKMPGNDIVEKTTVFFEKQLLSIK